MKKTNNIQMLKGSFLACLTFCAVTFSGCSEKMNKQTSSDANQSVETAATNTDNPMKEPEAVATITRYTYIQPIDLQRDDSKNMGKVLIDARNTSFKQLDTDNDDIVEKDEFYDGLFKLMDADGDNSIQDDEFMQEDIFLTTNPVSELNSLTAWDTDGNKELSKQELKTKLASLIDVPNGETLAQNLYIVWDTDNDDRIEKLELDKVIIRYDSDDNDK